MKAMKAMKVLKVITRKLNEGAKDARGKTKVKPTAPEKTLPSAAKASRLRRQDRRGDRCEESADEVGADADDEEESEEVEGDNEDDGGDTQSPPIGSGKLSSTGSGVGQLLHSLKRRLAADQGSRPSANSEPPWVDVRSSKGLATSLSKLREGDDLECMELGPTGRCVGRYFVRLLEVQFDKGKGVLAVAQFRGSDSEEIQRVMEDFSQDGMLEPKIHFCAQMPCPVKSSEFNIKRTRKPFVHVRKWRGWSDDGHRPDWYQPGPDVDKPEASDRREIHPGAGGIPLTKGASGERATGLSVPLSKLREALSSRKEALKNGNDREGAPLGSTVPVAPSNVSAGARSDPESDPAYLMRLLAERMAEREEQKSHQRGRSRDRRRHRRQRASSDSSSEGFRRSRALHGDDLEEESRRASGKLTSSCLEKMGRYLSVRQAGGQKQEMPPIVKAYLTSVLQPSAGDKLGLRSRQELMNLAEAMDSLLEGDLARGLDILSQRFQAVETAELTGRWNVARHMQLAGETSVTCVDPRVLKAAVAAEKTEQRLMGIGSHRSSG